MPSQAFMEVADEEVDVEFHGDDHDGPNEAWLWSNDYTNFWYPNDGCKDDLREWAYCMWDSRRLSQWGIIKRPYNAADSIPRDNALLIEHDRKYKEALQREDLRTDVWMRGGSGYWTEDESSIVWHKLPKIAQSVLPAQQTSAETEVT